MPDEEGGRMKPDDNRVPDNYLDALQRHADRVASAGKAVPVTAAPPIKEGIATGPSLAESQKLQVELAATIAYTPSKWLLEQEAALVAQRRGLHASRSNALSPTLDHRFRETDRAEDIYTWAREQELSGLCFSGGGIRSATFNLGILQGMAAKSWLLNFDYLSSVSGGGYIHSWLAAWLMRKREDLEKKEGDGQISSAWEHVMKRLCPLSADPPVAHPQLVWPRQILWLRRYSNYLTPRKGFLSGDTWAAIATWLRNVLLNHALLLLMFLSFLCLPHLLAPSTWLQPNDRTQTTRGSQTFAGEYGEKVENYLGHDHLGEELHEAWSRFPHTFTSSKLALLFYVIGCLSIGYLLRLEYGGAKAGMDESALPGREAAGLPAFVRRREFAVVCFGVIIPLLLFGITLAEIARTHTPGPFWTIKVFSLLMVLVWIETFCGGALGNAVAQEQDRRKAVSQPMPDWRYEARTVAGLVLLGIPVALLGTVLAVAIAVFLRSGSMTCIRTWLLLSDATAVQMTLGGLLFFWLIPFSMVTLAGMIGKMFPEWIGEWLARIRAYTLVAGAGWILIVACALLLPGVALRAWSWIQWTALAGWVGTTVMGFLSGKSTKTSGDQPTAGGIWEYAAVVAPYVYMGGLSLLLSLVLYAAYGPVISFGRQIACWAGISWLQSFAPWVGWLATSLCLAGLAALLGWRLDINQFSMHTFYRNRLTRCYLGASNTDRKPSPVTGFDEHDSRGLNIEQLTPDRYPGPIPIFCCTLNMTTGEDLAWQERKAASFAFTPLYSGYAVNWTDWKKGQGDVRINGFVRTGALYTGGPNLATAVAASGAAVSPNWGYHTNPATAFFLTMFDARLGLWIPNPRRSEAAGQTQSDAAVPPPSPRFAPIWLLSELFGSVNDTSKYVYLSDGGHFDNMGLYELVRRRCYRIVICDAEEDSTYVYEGIGAAIRKCRIDFGAEIELDLSGISPNTKTEWSPAHVVKGKIRYPETPPLKSGTVTYIKASLTAHPLSEPPVEGRVDLGHLPGDLQNYRKEHPHFPHDSTAEQWFTESQFESYRRLGQRIVDAMDSPF
ncbi:MAG: acyltransferase [Acidobacteriaceae bacterium]